MKKDQITILMNPVRQRIVQYLIIRSKGTVAEISADLSDIPRASLYRHIRILLEAELLQVVEEKAVRGAIEKTYALVQPSADGFTNTDISRIIQTSLLSIAASFGSYFKDEAADPAKDMLSVSSATLLLSDAEFMELFGKIGELYSGVMQNKPRGDRKPRCLTIISAPCLTENNHA